MTLIRKQVVFVVKLATCCMIQQGGRVYWSSPGMASSYILSFRSGILRLPQPFRAEYTLCVSGGCVFQAKRNALLDNAEVQPSTSQSDADLTGPCGTGQEGTKRRHNGRVLMSNFEAEADLTPS